MRKKRRYILIYTPNQVKKDDFKDINVTLIERDENYAILRCNLSDLPKVMSNLLDREVITLTISGTLKKIREKKSIIKESFS